MPVESTATELLARLQSLAAKPAEFTRARKEVRRWQEGDAELQRQFAEYRASLGVAPGPAKRPDAE